MKNDRILLTQEQYRKQQRNARWMRTALLSLPYIAATAACVAAVYMMVVHGHR